jgi:chromosome segregation ATPase
MITMSRTSSSIKSVLDNVRIQLEILEADIKAAEKSKMEFERHLTILENKKQELQARVKKNTEWAETYDAQVGPFAARYNDMTTKIGEIYDNAKKNHKKGLIHFCFDFN